MSDAQPKRAQATAEQKAIRDDARANPGDGRRCVAFAGTGKTTTLRMLAQDRKDPGVYIAFNRPIKEDAARRFPPHVKALTAHGAAFGALAMWDQQSRLEKRIFGDQVGKMVRLPRCRVPEDALGQIVLDTVARFCNSADLSLSDKHVALHADEPEDVRMAALAGAGSLWARMSDPDDFDCPITHDTYLKLWQLGDAKLSGIEWALFDEAQDASPVMVDVMLRQGIPITWCGDENQQIYAWRGAVNAMRLMPGTEFPLTRSFRFGQGIADVANAVLKIKPSDLRPKFQLAGNPDRISGIGKIPRDVPHTFLSRTNSEWFEAALAFPGAVHVIGGIEETEKLLNGAWGLWRHGDRPKKAPAVARFATWKEMCDHAERFDDRELSFARKIVEQYRENLPREISGLRSRHVEHEDDAELVLSTAHKAKGREWPYVRLGSGFPTPADPKWKAMSAADRDAEVNLLYVALTRAVTGLEPNMAVMDCLDITRDKGPRGSPPVSRILPELKVERVIPPAAPADEFLSPARLPEVGPRPAFRHWTAEEDATVLRLNAGGTAVDDISISLGRPAAAIEVRLSVLGAAGSDPLLPGELLVALMPVPTGTSARGGTLRRRETAQARDFAIPGRPQG